MFGAISERTVAAASAFAFQHSGQAQITCARMAHFIQADSSGPSRASRVAGRAVWLRTSVLGHRLVGKARGATCPERARGGCACTGGATEDESCASGKPLTSSEASVTSVAAGQPACAPRRCKCACASCTCHTRTSKNTSLADTRKAWHAGCQVGPAQGRSAPAVFRGPPHQCTVRRPRPPVRAG